MNELELMKQNYRSANEEISGLRVALEESRSNGDRLHRESELVVHNVNTWVQEQKWVLGEREREIQSWESEIDGESGRFREMRECEVERDGQLEGGSEIKAGKEISVFESEMDSGWESESSGSMKSSEMERGNVMNCECESETESEKERGRLYQGKGLGPIRYNNEGMREVHFLALGGGDTGHCWPLAKGSQLLKRPAVKRPELRRKPQVKRPMASQPLLRQILTHR